MSWRQFAKKMFLKDFWIQRKTLVPESSFKVAECFKKETLAQVFHCRFHKMFKKCFVQPLQRFASEIAKFQATSSLFIKESVVFNCLNIENKKTWFSCFLILKSFYPNTFLITALFQKKTNRGDSGHGTWRGIGKSKHKFQNQLKKK